MKIFWGVDVQIHIFFNSALVGGGGTRKRSWLRHYATSWKVAGLSPDEVDSFNLPNPRAALWPWG
jgi:hypothetical protein